MNSEPAEGAAVSAAGPADGQGPVKVVLAEDSTLLREGLVRLLTEAGFEVVGAYGDAQALLAALDEDQPDVAMLDVRLPPGFTDEGIRAALELRRSHPGVAILTLSQYLESLYAEELFASGQGGLGYLLKERVTSLESLTDAINRVNAGGTALDPKVVSGLLRSKRDPLASLSEREAQALELMAQGYSNTEISRQMTIGVGTLEKHIAAVFSKLDLADTGTEHRRVRAVLTWLRAH